MEENLIIKFKEYGVDQKTIVVAVQVYLELCEVRRYYDVTAEYNKSLETIILKAKKRATERYSTFLPLPAYENLNFQKLQHILDSCQVDSFYLVLVHPDSTCVYYELSGGLLPPLETAKHRHLPNQKKLDNWISKNKEIVKQAALCQMPLLIQQYEPNVSEPSCSIKK